MGIHSQAVRARGGSDYAVWLSQPPEAIVCRISTVADTVQLQYTGRLLTRSFVVKRIVSVCVRWSIFL